MAAGAILLQRLEGGERDRIGWHRNIAGLDLLGARQRSLGIGSPWTRRLRPSASCLVAIVALPERPASSSGFPLARSRLLRLGVRRWLFRLGGSLPQAARRHPFLARPLPEPHRRSSPGAAGGGRIVAVAGAGVGIARARAVAGTRSQVSEPQARRPKARSPPNNVAAQCARTRERRSKWSSAMSSGNLPLHGS